MSVSNSGSTSSSGTSLVINGLISGISTQQVIQALLQSYEQPITNLEEQQGSLNNASNDYKAINTDMQSVLNAAQALNTPSSWNLMAATSSNSSIATATSSPGAQGGSITFDVQQLASGNLLLSTGSVPSQSSSITSASSAAIGVGTEAIGIDGLTSSGLSLGSHQISVTQASQAATVAGTSAPGASTTITTGTNDNLDLSVNGSPVSLTLAAGTYSASGLVAAINTAATNATAGLTASLNADGEIQFSTNEQGSAATLSVSGGDAATSLGLVAGTSATGANAVVSVDGTTTTLTSVVAGAEVSLNVATGSLAVAIGSSPGASGSLLSSGSANLSVVSTGSGSLGNVVSAINASGAGATASAVEQANGSYRLQVTANQTGLAGAVTLDSSLSGGSGIGSMQTVTQAADAAVTVGGATGYSLSSSSNTFNALMPGTTITAISTGVDTVTVSPDGSGESKLVSNLVSAANQAISDIQTVSGYNESTKTGGPLMGSAILQSISNEIGSIFSSAAGTSGLGSSSNVGITLNSNGSLTYSSSQFETAFNADPSKVATLFTQDGTFSPSASTPNASATLIYAGDNTEAGNYEVAVSQSASQASDDGTTLAGGSVSVPETLTFAMGGAQATYEVNSSESLSSIATGLNGVFAAQGLNLSATVNGAGTALQVSSNSYGSAASFTAESTASGPGTTGLGGASPDAPVTYTGTDVAGTINGVTATGVGQVLSAPTDDPTLDGLSLDIPTGGISSLTTIGSFQYVPGLAQQLASLANSASNAQNGSLTTAAQGLTNESTGLNQQIAMYQTFASSQQSVLQKEFDNMETALGQLKNQGSELSTAISQLP